METKICPNCRKTIAVINEKCPLCGFDLTKELSDAQVHQEKLKQALKPSDSSTSPVGDDSKK